MKSLILAMMLFSTATAFASSLYSSNELIDGDLVIKDPQMKVAGILYRVSAHPQQLYKICEIFKKRYVSHREEKGNKQVVEMDDNGHATLGYTNQGYYINNVICN